MKPPRKIPINGPNFGEDYYKNKTAIETYFPQIGDNYEFEIAAPADCKFIDAKILHGDVILIRVCYDLIQTRMKVYRFKIIVSRLLEDDKNIMPLAKFIMKVEQEAEIKRSEYYLFELGEGNE